MRFLIVTKTKHPLPPEMAMGLFDAMLGWVDMYTQGGRMEQVWSFSGLQGGGGILNVESLDELDEIMVRFPFAPFSHTDIYGLSEIHDALDRGKQVISQMMQGA